MDCGDARFFLRFRRPGSPGAGELAPEDASALDQHLGGCPHCSTEARNAASFDAALGTAMRAVEMPAGLRTRLIAGTSAVRGTALRRRAARYTALAASVLLAIGIGAAIFTASRPRPDLEELTAQADTLAGVLRFEPLNQGPLNPTQVETNRAALRAWLRAERLPELPADLDFDYNLLVSYHWEEVQGRQVPVILFRGRDQGFAKVYAFRATQFKLNEMSRAVQGSFCQSTTIPMDWTPGLTFVIVHTSPTLAPFPRGSGPLT